MKIVGVVGRSKSGKTTLIKRLIPELKKRGLSVAAIKHCRHGFDLDLEGKDSWEFMEAGAEGVGLVGPDRVAVIKKRNAGEGLTAQAARYLPEADLVLVEGGPGIAGLKKIEVVGTGRRAATPRGELLALVSEQKPAVGIPRFRPGDIAEIADFLETQVRQAESIIRIEVDGRELSLNHFVRIISENVVLGIVRSLKGVEDQPRSVVIALLSASQKDKKP